MRHRRLFVWSHCQHHRGCAWPHQARHGHGDAVTGTNTYTGPTTVSGGELIITSNLTSSSSITVASGATMDLTGATDSTSGTITNNGTLILGAGVNLSSTGAFTNYGTLNLSADAGYTLPGNFVNHGTVIPASGGSSPTNPTDTPTMPPLALLILALLLFFAATPSSLRKKILILWTVPPAIPPVIGLLPDVVLGAHFLHRRPGLRLPHDPYNLFHCESTLFHFVLLSLLKQNYTYVMSSFLGSGQGEPRRDPRVAVGEAAEGIARAGDPPERIAGLDCKSGLLHENNQSREQSRFLLVWD
jgi:hypothetical protein